MIGGKKPGLAAGAKFYAQRLRMLALKIELAAMTPEELIKNAVSIAEEVLDAADVAKERRVSAAKARAKRAAQSQKPKILAEIKKAQADGWDRGSASRIGRKFGVKASYVRRLKDAT